MNNPTQTSLDIEGARRFHGHSCPGLTMGIRVAEIALREIGSHSADEEVVCITETDHCGVDAIQYLTGCTFGKGNLIHRDYGKSVFTFVRRSDGKAIRIAAKPDFWGKPDPKERAIFDRLREGHPVTAEERQYFQQSREARIQAISQAPPEGLFDVREIDIEMPDKARILDSILCAKCGEATMASQVRRLRGEPYCKPCFEALTQEHTV